MAKPVDKIPVKGVSLPVCRVCGHNETRLFPVGKISYWRCLYCEATFIDSAHLPDKDDERKRYEQHINNPDDPGYRRFLNKAATPLIACLSPGRRGLDYGCGPASAMASMMSEAGHAITLYDPFFFPEPAALRSTYDFIVCTEVAEHFHNPGSEFKKLDSLLRPGGYLLIMTCFQTSDEKFANWHYRRDFTHVVFYRRRTFHVIARLIGWHCEIVQKDVVIMQKRHESG